MAVSFGVIWSSVGRKILMSLTGLLLFTFVVGHLDGKIEGSQFTLLANTVAR